MLSVGTMDFEDSFCISRKGGMGEVDGVRHRHWRLSWLAVERPWSALGGLHKWAQKMFLSPSRCSISG